MDEISHGPQREPRLRPASFPWLPSLSSAWSSSPAELRVAGAGAGVLIGAAAVVGCDEDGWWDLGGGRQADGSQGLEFQACQRPGPGRAGWVDIYNVGFSIAPGRSAAVEVLTRGSAPAWLTFTAPAASG